MYSSEIKPLKVFRPLTGDELERMVTLTGDWKLEAYDALADQVLKLQAEQGEAELEGEVTTGPPTGGTIGGIPHRFPVRTADVESLKPWREFLDAKSRPAAFKGYAEEPVIGLTPKDWWDVVRTRDDVDPFTVGKPAVPHARRLAEAEIAYRSGGSGDNGDALWDLAGEMIRAGRLRGYPTVAAFDSLRQGLYVAMRLDGSSHAMAEMLALQSPPMSNTDREFLEGHCNGNQFEDTPWVGDYYRAKAEAAGVDTTGKVYLSCLANEPGDVEAWVGGRGDAARVVESRGWSSTGSVNVKGRDDGPPPEIGIADDVVEDRMLGKMEADPDLAERVYRGEVDMAQALGECRDEIKPHWAA